MTLEERVARSFQMDEETWERHANPWSVWTRFTAWPLIALAAWSRARLGWLAIIPLIGSVLWTWFNPRIFDKPRSTDNWASKAVLGERVWANRNTVPVPEQHRRMPSILNGVAGLGSIIAIWGLLRLKPWPTLFGTALIYAGKLWYLDRMVWLYEDMKEENPQYKRWEY
jgi:hypothetical protein